MLSPFQLDSHVCSISNDNNHKGERMVQAGVLPFAPRQITGSWSLSRDSLIRGVLLPSVGLKFYEWLNVESPASAEACCFLNTLPE